FRYNLMANRVLLLLATASRYEPNIPNNVLMQISGHFLKNLKSQLPQTRILAISGLNTLLKKSPCKYSAVNGLKAPDYRVEDPESSLEEAFTGILQEEGFFSEILDSLSHVHIINDIEAAPAKGSYDGFSWKITVEKSLSRFYFDFSASWPRTPNWIYLFGNDSFQSTFARTFKRLIQECGSPALSALRNSLEIFVGAKERPKQCVAAEALAGALHSDISGLSEAWDDWIEALLFRIIYAPSVESIPEWVAAIRYAVSGKGHSGSRAPLLRHKIIDCLMKPLPQTLTTSTVAKRYAFLSAALIEISPSAMSEIDIKAHYNLLEELLTNMNHSSAQVREAIGVSLSVVCSNLRLHATLRLHEGGASDADSGALRRWDQSLVKQASEFVAKIQSFTASEKVKPLEEEGSILLNNDSQDEIKWMETAFHFIISTLRSGRSSVLLDVIVRLMHPVIALQ
ncbi:hypothetical protein M569_13716, partial [Genlisea aurea]